MRAESCRLLRVRDSDAERRETAMDANTRCSRGRVEPFGDASVVEVVDDAKLDRLALAGRQSCERFIEALEPRFVRLLVGPIELGDDPEALAGRALEAPARTDASRTFRAIPKSHGAADPFASSRKRPREIQTCANVSAVRSCADLIIARAPELERVDAGRVPVVELAESTRVRARGFEQACITPDRPLEHPRTSPPPSRTSHEDDAGAAKRYSGSVSSASSACRSSGASVIVKPCRPPGAAIPPAAGRGRARRRCRPGRGGRSPR